MIVQKWIAPFLCLVSWAESCGCEYAMANNLEKLIGKYFVIIVTKCRSAGCLVHVIFVSFLAKVADMRSGMHR